MNGSPGMSGLEETLLPEGCLGRRADTQRFKSREGAEWEYDEQSAYFQHRVPITFVFSVAGIQRPLLIYEFAPFFFLLH